MICCGCEAEEKVKEMELITFIHKEKRELDPTGFLSFPICSNCLKSLSVELVLNRKGANMTDSDKDSSRWVDHWETTFDVGPMINPST